MSDGEPPDKGAESPLGSDRAQYTAEEERELRSCAEGAGEVRCPRCGQTMTRRSIGGGSFGLGYARRRIWLLCPGCRRSVIFDAARGTRN